MGNSKFWEVRRSQVRQRAKDEYGLPRCEECDERSYWGDTSHRIGLGMGRSRHDPEDPLNDLENLQYLCRLCHETLEETRRREKMDRPWGT